MGSLLTTSRRMWSETVGHQQHVRRGSCSLRSACPLGYWAQDGHGHQLGQASQPAILQPPWLLHSSSASSYIPNWHHNLPGARVQFSQRPAHTPSSSPASNALRGSSGTTVLSVGWMVPGACPFFQLSEIHSVYFIASWRFVHRSAKVCEVAWSESCLLLSWPADSVPDSKGKNFSQVFTGTEYPY